MKTILTGKEQQQAYSREYKRLKPAMQNEFYPEGVSIGYAIIEDRLAAFLHHAGIVSRDSGELKITRHAKPFMIRLLGIENGTPVKVKDVSVKMKLIRSLMKMTEEEAEDIDAQVNAAGKARAAFRRNYMADLYRQIDRTIDRGRIMVLLRENGKPDEWRVIRNQLIHALLRKSSDLPEEEKRICAETGMELSREIDNVPVKPFKRIIFCEKNTTSSNRRRKKKWKMPKKENRKISPRGMGTKRSADGCG